MNNIKQYDSLASRFNFESKGWILMLEGGKWSYKVRLHILPIDDTLEAQGEIFNSAMEAVTALASVYGQKINDLLEGYEP